MEISISKGRITLSVKVLHIGEDILIIISGGKAHIGAVSLTNHKNAPKTISLDSHKEDVITSNMAKTLQTKTKKNLCIIAGVHFNDILPREINDVLALCEDVAKEISGYLQKF